MAEYTFDSVNYKFEREHFAQEDSIVRVIQRYYDDVVNQIAPFIASGASQRVINKKLDQILTTLVKKTVTKIETGMQKSWQIAEDRTKAYVETKYIGMELPPQVEKALNAHRTKARDQFIKQAKGGLTLSDRVWKSADRYRDLINQQLEEGIQEGRSAVKVAKELREALRDTGIQQTPGQGVNKSPVKNAERVARTQINMAYRASDQEAWMANPLVLGYRINLSATNKPKVRCEICRALAGDYPVTYVWSGNHPHCLCFKTPILMSRKMLDAYNKLVARGEDTLEAIAKLQKKVRVTDVPQGFKDWVSTNAERVEGWKSQPFWWKDNLGVIEKVLKGAG
jgi:hypothetical protein